MPALHALQRASGWISPGGLDYACRILEVPPAEAYGVATFYHLFSDKPPKGDQILHVCDDIACILNGANDLIDASKQEGYETKQRFQTQDEFPQIWLIKNLTRLC